MSDGVDDDVTPDRFDGIGLKVELVTSGAATLVKLSFFELNEHGMTRLLKRLNSPPAAWLSSKFHLTLDSDFPRNQRAN